MTDLSTFPRTKLFGEPFCLLPQRAVFRPATATLYVADIHIGKASAFAHGGVALADHILDASTVADLQRLGDVVDRTAARRLVILGDLFHARAGCDDRTVSLLSAWRDGRTSLDILLVRGNHDLRAGDPADHLAIACVPEPFADEGLELRHYPVDGIEPDGAPILAGHLHPAVRIADAGPGGLKTPCFLLCEEGRQLILPAFGGFIAGGLFRPGPGDRVFVPGDGRVFELPRAADRRPSRARRV